MPLQVPGVCLYATIFNAHSVASSYHKDTIILAPSFATTCAGGVVPYPFLVEETFLALISPPV